MKKVLLLLCQGVELYEAAAFHDVLGWSGTYGSEEVQVVTAGLHRSVRAAFGTMVIPDKLLLEVEAADYDALAIPGGFETWGFQAEAYGEDIAGLIRAFHELCKPIASICVGALPLANSGILEGCRATTYHLMGGVRRRQLADFGAEVVDEPLVADGNVVTSTSPATALDVAFDLLARLTGGENAANIRGLMGFGPEPLMPGGHENGRKRTQRRNEP